MKNTQDLYERYIQHYVDLSSKMRSSHYREMCFHTNEHYYEIMIPKRNGDFRTIMVPDDDLKDMQKRIAKVFELALIIMDSNRPPRQKGGCSFGFEKGKSIVMNADMHKEGKYFFKADISQFFSSISFHVVFRLLKFAVQVISYDIRTSPISNDRKKYYLTKLRRAFKSTRRDDADTFYEMMANLLCENGVLATGSPASPIISNYYMRSFDNRVLEYLHKLESSQGKSNKYVYTRYADDITISSQMKIPAEVKKEIMSYLKQKKLYLNQEKTHYQSNKAKNVITGINVTKDGQLTVGKHKKIAVKKMLYEVIKTPSKEDLNKIGYKVAGNISYLYSVEPEYTHKLLVKYTQLAERFTCSDEIKQFFQSLVETYNKKVQHI